MELNEGTIPLTQAEADEVERLRADPGIIGLTREDGKVVVTLEDGTEVEIGGFTTLP